MLCAMMRATVSRQVVLSCCVLLQSYSVMHWRSMYSAATGCETPAVAVAVGGVSGCRLCAADVEWLE